MLRQVSNGAAALEKVKEQSPDLIILDLMLPGIGGYEFLKELQARGCGDIPVVVLSARSVEAKIIEMIKLEPNVKEFLGKPPKASFGLLLHNLLKTRPPLPS